jgi:hypothetical protein
LLVFLGVDMARFALYLRAFCALICASAGCIVIGAGKSASPERKMAPPKVSGGPLYFIMRL